MYSPYPCVSQGTKGKGRHVENLNDPINITVDLNRKNLQRTASRWVVSSPVLRTPSALSEIRSSQGTAKSSLHWSTTGFVLSASLYDSVICSIQGDLLQFWCRRSLGLLSRLLLPWLGLFCFVWGLLCNSSPGVIHFCVGGLYGLCASEEDMLLKQQGAPRGHAVHLSNSA